jgi:L-ribulose-5-phosphate 4-epimerase
MSGSEAVDAAVGRLRGEVCALHAELIRWGLVTWTSGNISARVPDVELMVIKPTGVSYDELTPMSMVVCDLHGKAAPDSTSQGERPSGLHRGTSLRPSSDAAAHAYIYRELPGVGGVVHTHSPYATAWAARGEAIPCVLTAMADEFGGEIPVGPFAPVGGEEIGAAVVGTLAGHRSPAVLLASHGVFAIGATARDAVKAAAMCEDAARTVHLARQLGAPVPLSHAQVDALHRRYLEEYGQRPAASAVLAREAPPGASAIGSGGT